MAEDLIRQNYKKWREIGKLQKNISKLKQEINNNEREIYKICEHCWEYDTSVGPYDRIKYNCTKCGLWKSNTMYS